MALIRWLLSFIERKPVPMFFRPVYLGLLLKKASSFLRASAIGTCSDNHMRSLVLTAYRVG